jgi:hypothetical protein
MPCRQWRYCLSWFANYSSPPRVICRDSGIEAAAAAIRTEDSALAARYRRVMRHSGHKKATRSGAAPAEFVLGPLDPHPRDGSLAPASSSPTLPRLHPRPTGAPAPSLGPSTLSGRVGPARGRLPRTKRHTSTVHPHPSPRHPTLVIWPCLPPLDPPCGILGAEVGSAQRPLATAAAMSPAGGSSRDRGRGVVLAGVDRLWVRAAGPPGGLSREAPRLAEATPHPSPSPSCATA